MTDEALAALRETGRALEDLAGRLSAALQGTAGATGEDPSGAVQVTLDERGRIGSVVVAPGWRRQVGTASLATAIGSAHAAAGQQFVRRLDDALAAPDGAAPQAGPAPGAAPARTHAPASAPAAAVRLPDLRDVAEATAELRAQVREAQRLAEMPVAPVVGRDPSRQVEVTLAGDVPQSVTFGVGWEVDASDAQVGLAVSAALRDAYGRADAAGPHRLLGGRAFTELSALLGDPEQVAALFRPQARGEAR